MQEKMEELATGLKSKLPTWLLKLIWREAETKDSDSKQKSKANIKIDQIKNLALVIIVIFVAIGLVASFIKSNRQEKKKEDITDKISLDEIEIEVASKDLDGEKMWRNHFEELLKKTKDNQKKELKNVIENIKEEQEASKKNQDGQISNLLTELQLAREELGNASAELQAIRRQQEQEEKYLYPDVNMMLEDYRSDVIYDEPKPANTYIPAGTYFNGYLLGGIAVSTALNAPNENATPVILRLTSGGNLDKESKLDVKRCRITGSAYGDLSSERAIIRLEQLVCKQDGMWVVSNIAGLVHGADGMTGIKGKVVETSSKHVQNAAIGGLVSGFSNSVKGQDSMAIVSGGMLSTKSRGLKSMATSGALTGVSNAGEKLADYYLRQAERMSPVLTIPGGVKINATITKGFHIGQLNTHEAIKKERKRQSGHYQQQVDNVMSGYTAPNKNNEMKLNKERGENENNSVLSNW